MSWASFWATTEAEVVDIITKIKTETEILKDEVDTALKWIADNTPMIAQDLQRAAGLAEAVGIASNPQVAAAITAANLAVQGLNAFAAASNSGATNPAAVIAGYAAVKEAQAAAASAAAAATKAPVK